MLLRTVGLVSGRAGLPDLGGRLVRWRVPARTYGVALGLPEDAMTGWARPARFVDRVRAAGGRRVEVCQVSPRTGRSRCGCTAMRPVSSTLRA